MMFPHREAQAFYDFGEDPEQEQLVDDIVAHEWARNSVKFLVQWADSSSTWEPWSTVHELEALDRYFEIQGITDWRALAKPPKNKSRAQRGEDTDKTNEAAPDLAQPLEVSGGMGQVASGPAPRHSERVRAWGH